MLPLKSTYSVNTGLHTHKYNRCKGTCSLSSVLKNINLLDKKLYTIKINTETLLVTSKKVSLQTNMEEIKYVLMSHDKNAGQTYNIKIAGTA